MKIKLSWNDFITNITERSIIPQWFIMESEYHIHAFDRQIELYTRMDIEIVGEESVEQLYFEANYKSKWNIPLNSTPDAVRTEKEKSDIVLKMASGKVISDANGLAVLDIKVPGTFDGVSGRYVQGGSAWFVNYRPDDNFQVFVIDKDDLLGYGAGTQIGSYTEVGANAGFYAEPDGKVRVNTLGFFGFIPSGMYLRMQGQCGSGITDTLYMNIVWGELT